VLVTASIGRTVADGDPDDVAPVVESLRFQRAALERGSAADAQELFPEGAYFSYVLEGLAWTDLGASGGVDAATARAMARHGLDGVGSTEGTAAFAEELTPRFGIFYAGWTLLLRAQVAALEPDPPSEEVAEVRAGADAIAAAFTDALDAGRSPFLAAYPDQTWPVDNVVALAALRQADVVTGQDHGPLVARWIEQALEHADPRTGLLPHRTDPVTGAAIDGSRGTSQSIIQRLWPILDPASAPEVYRRFREHFVTGAAGFVGVREYPVGVDGAGDVDSGPLVLGFSASASAVTIGAARANGDLDLAAAILHEADVFGLPLTLGGERRYAFGALPIGDAFVAWARAAPAAPPTEHPAVTPWWPGYLIVPWLVIGGIWLALAIAARRARRSRHGDDPAPADAG
jgi:hypothetical protein